MKVIGGDWDYEHFKREFYAWTGLNLDCYKDRQMKRRIKQMMQRKNRSDFAHFYRYLREDARALTNFCHYLTINTSEFFRDDKVFNCLEEEILPELLQRYPRELRIWSAGCSMGAEPFSVAILLHKLNALTRTQIFATDLDEKVLAMAQKGEFGPRYLQKIPDYFRRRYFEKKGEEYLINETIRRAVTFKRHNLLIDKPISGCHMIFCRNVFIYFKDTMQKTLLKSFSGNLRPGGFLVIGLAEHISNPGQYGLDKRCHRIFQKH